MTEWNELSTLAGIIAWETDLNLNFTFVSESARSVLGIPPNQWLESPAFWASIIHESDRSRIRQFRAQETRARRAYECEYRCVAADGRVVWMRDKAMIRHDDRGEPIGLRGFMQDITAFKSREERLRQSEVRYSIASRLNRNAIWEWDPASNQLIWNEGISTLFYYSEKTMKTDIFFWYDNLHPDDRERVVSGLHAALDRGNKQWEDEYRFRTAEGSYRYVVDRGWMIRDEAGRAVRMIGSMTDVTFIKQAMKERDELLKSERTAKAQAEREHRIRDELMSSVAHDLKNPLSSILLNIKLMRRAMPRSADLDVSLQNLNRVQEASEHMRILIEDLMQVARAEAGELALDRQEHDAYELLHEAGESVRAELVNAGLQLNLKITDIGARLIGDGALLEKMLSRLLRFMIRHSPPDGTLVLQESFTEGEEIIRYQNPAWKLSDEGLQALFFNPRNDIDFAVAKAILRAHDGRIWVQSGEEEGTVVSFAIPASVAKPRQILIAS